jgi:hypothetical protein
MGRDGVVRNILRRWVCAGLLLALAAPLLTACSNAAKTSTVVGLDDSIDALASGGVAVMEDVTSPSPIVGLTGQPSAMRFTRWQVRNLVAEANAHGGYLGSDLDALVTPPAGSPGLSVIVGAWLKRDEGALAHYARRFMGDQDYAQSKTIMFPTIVVLSFVADIARATPPARAGPTAFDLGPWIAAPAEAANAAGTCSDIANWVSTVVNNVTTAVQANGSGWLASLWNVVVSIAGTAFTIVANGLLQPIVGFVTEVATVVGTLMQVASMFKPWTVKLAADPSIQVLGPSPGSGAFDATLTAQDVAWPQTLVDCVKTLTGGHVDLTDASYKNARVTWSQPIGIPLLASNDSKDATLLADKTAHYTYTTVTRPPIAADDCPRLFPAGSIGITLTVERRDVSKVIDSLVQLIANRLPAKLQGFLEPYEQPAIDAAKAAVGNFKGPRASATASVMEYDPDPRCEHTPPPTTPTPQAAQTGELPLAPCEAVLASGNIGAAYPGAIILNNIPHNPEFRKFLANQALEILMLARRSGVQTHGEENDPRIAGQSACAIGPPYVSPPDPTQDVAPPIEAIFITLPADGTPVDTAKSNPECLAALGPELAYFKAECWIQHVRDHVGGPVNSTMIFVFTKDAEYVNEAIGPSDAGTVLMRSVLQGLEHGPPPTATPQPTPEPTPKPTPTPSPPPPTPLPPPPRP